MDSSDDNGGEDEDVELEIDLEDENDQSLIRTMIKSIYDENPTIKDTFGDGFLEMTIEEMIQVFEAYQNGGVSAIMDMLEVDDSSTGD